MVARWKPVHLGHCAALRALHQQASQVLLGIGSANRYNLRNPFTLEETTDMLNLVLEGYSNFDLVPVPDLDDGPRWREMVVGLFGPLDAFVTDNPYVAHLLRQEYPILRPVSLVPPEERLALNGTQVRREMATGGDWQSLVPGPVAGYILQNGLDQRFRREFGLQTLAQAVD